MKGLHLSLILLAICFCLEHIGATEIVSCVLLKNCPSALYLTQAEIEERICGYEDNRYAKIRCTISCITPDSEKGVCISSDSCKPFMDVYLNSDPKNIETRTYLRKFVCSSISNIRRHYVCCPNKPLPARHTTPSSAALSPPTRPPLLDNSECGIASDQYKIVKGEIAAIGDHPWAVLLQYYSGGRAFTGCGGTLLNHRYVLTAAHCINERVGRLTNVILGEHNTSSTIDCYGNALVQQACAPEPKTIRIEQIIQHPGWLNAATPFYDDIALLRLARNVEYSDFIRPICLPKSLPSRAQKLVVVGWGKSEYGISSEVKRVAFLPVQERSQCLNTISIPTRQTQLCVGGESSDSCKGDSGGPLLLPVTHNELTVWYIAGIVSLGYDAPCGTIGKPGIYTSVFHYLNWIQQNIQ